MELYETFRFGQFKGLRLIDVFQGTLNINRRLLKKYIQTLLNSEDLWNYEKHFGLTHFQFIDKFEVTKKHITLLGMRLEPWDDNSTKRNNVPNIESLLQSYLTVGNTWQGKLISGVRSLEDINKIYRNKQIICGGPDYICWCIKEVDDFFISDRSIRILESLKTTKFIGVNVIYKGNNIYEYAPITETLKFSFPKKIKNLNREKLNLI